MMAALAPPNPLPALGTSKPLAAGSLSPSTTATLPVQLQQQQGQHRPVTAGRPQTAGRSQRKIGLAGNVAPGGLAALGGIGILSGSNMDNSSGAQNDSGAVELAVEDGTSNPLRAPYPESKQPSNAFSPARSPDASSSSSSQLYTTSSVTAALSTSIISSDEDDDDDENSGRDRWGSRVSFILAAIGSAIGIGNLWRFPYLAYRYGGGAFFIPYFIALFIVGIPLLQLEFALGQFFQGGHAVAFNSLSKRARGLGLAGPYSAFLVVIYYGAILSWGLIYFVCSFKNPLPWETKNLAMTETCETLITLDSCEAVDVCKWNGMACRPEAVVQADEFFVDVLNVKPPTEFTMEGCGYAVAALAVTWICIFLAIFRGARMLGKVLYVTMVLPVILLFVMTIRAVALEGADDGIRQYLFTWNFSILVEEPEIWSAAVGQIFFSIGVTYGIMTAYASFNRKQQNVVQDAIIVAGSNSAFSIVAGIVVFAMAGHLAYISNGSLEDLKTSGVGLVFMTFPTALAEMAGYSAQIFSALFFLMFFLLGIDSAFSMVEATVTLFTDSRPLRNVKKTFVILPICIVGFLFALPFVSSVGTTLIDIVDYALANIASVFIGFCECAVAGWLQGMSQQAAVVGWSSVSLLAVSYFGSLALGTSIGFGVKTQLDWAGGMPAGTVLGPIFGVVFFVVGTLFAVCLMNSRGTNTAAPIIAENPPRTPQPLPIGSPEESQRLTEQPASETRFRDRVWWLFLGNIEMLRRELNSVIGADRRCCACNCPSFLSTLRLPWALVIKFVIPAFLSILLAETLSSKDLFKYGGYPVGYQAAAFSLSFLAVAMIILGVLLPALYRELIPDDITEEGVKPIVSTEPTVTGTSGSVDSEQSEPQVYSRLAIPNLPQENL